MDLGRFFDGLPGLYEGWGTGATFAISLPLVQQPAPEATRSPAWAAAAGAAATQLTGAQA